MEMLQVVFTSVLSALSLFVIAKVIGHKQMSQLDFFDYITGITIGSIAAELATELEEPWKPLAAMIVYGLITVLLAVLTSKSARMRKFINGTPTILMDGGKIYRRNLKKAKIDLSEFLVLCRQAGYFNLADIQTAVFEYNGRLTVLPVSTKRPLNPEDVKVTPPPERIGMEVIMDGRILEENLKRRGLDRRWLEKRLEEQGGLRAKEIFLAVCDQNNQLSLYRNA